MSSAPVVAQGSGVQQIAHQIKSAQHDGLGLSRGAGGEDQEAGGFRIVLFRLLFRQNGDFIAVDDGGNGNFGIFQKGRNFMPGIRQDSAARIQLGTNAAYGCS